MLEAKKLTYRDFRGSLSEDQEIGFKRSGAICIYDDRLDETVLARSVPIALQDRTGCRLTAQVRTDNAVTTRSLMRMVFLGRDGRPLGCLESPGTLSAEWTPQEICAGPGDFPPGAFSLRIELVPAADSPEATGCAWFDDLRLVPFAPAPAPPQPREDEDDLTQDSFYIDSSSSSLRGLSELPVELKDGNDFTGWAPSPGDERPSIEISWGMARRPSRLLFLPCEGADMPGAIRISAYDEAGIAFGKAAEFKVTRHGSWGCADLSGMVPTRKITVLWPKELWEGLREMRLYAERRPIESYSGWWIWHTREAEGHIERVLRKAFTLDSPVQTAFLQGKGDDEAVFYINGMRCDGQDVTALVKEGENILAAEVRNHRYVGGLLAELDVVCRDGKALKVVTDGSWRTAPRPDDGGHCLDPDFDDDHWDHAQEIVRPPNGIWGDIPFEMRVGRVPVRLEGSFFPPRVTAGTDAAVRLRLVPEAPVGRRAPVTVRICRNGLLFKETGIGNGAELMHAAPGTVLEMEGAMAIGSSWPEGEYEAMLQIPFVRITGGGPVLKFFLKNPRKATAAKAAIAPAAGGMPMLHVNGRPLWNIFFTVPYAAGYRMQSTMAREFCNAGCKVARVWAHMLIKDDGEFDFTPVDAQVARVLDDAPDTLLILCFMMDRGIQGDFFRKRHPEEMAVFDNGAAFGKPSLASEAWHAVAGAAVKGLVEHVLDSPYAGNVIGYLPCGGEEGQWLHHWGGNDPARPGALGDYSQPMRRYFRGFLRKKYATDQRLRQAWHDDGVSLDTAEIPDRTARILPLEGGMFRDPVRDRASMDFGEALSQCINDNLKYYAGIIKKATGHRSLVGFFYGHLADVGDGYIAELSGYLKQQELLECKDIDFFCGPLEYRWQFRDLGGTSSFDYPTPSMLRSYNKIWMQEDDLRTHLHPREYAYGVRRPEESCAVLAREFAKSLSGGALMYLHEFGTDQRNWFDDVALLRELGRLQTLGARALYGSLAPVSEIAVIASDRVFHCMRQEKRYVFRDQAGTRCFFQRAEIGRIGAPFEEYMVDAFLKDSAMPDYRLYIFLNVFCLYPEERDAIRRKLARNGATALWLYAPGYFDGSSMDTGNMLAATGIRFAETRLDGPPRMKMLPGNKLLGEYTYSFGMCEEDRMSPVFIVDDPEAEALAELCNAQGVAMARKRTDGAVHFYASFPILPPEVLRAVARTAGVHIYDDRNDAVYACESLLAIHTCRESGTREIKLPGKADVSMLYPEERPSRRIDSFRVEAETPSTFIYRIENMEHKRQDGGTDR